MNIIKSIKKSLGAGIWDLSEYFNIHLGRFAPTIFGWMIGCKDKKIK